MADILQFPNNERINAEIAAYYDAIGDLSRLAINGEITPTEYRDRMNEAVTSAIFMAFLLGGGSLNNNRGRAFIEQQRRIAFNSVGALGRDIYNGRYSDDNGLEMLDNRLVLWTFALGGVWNKSKLIPPIQRPGIDPRTGEIITPEEPRLMWVYDPKKDHCRDCADLHGTVLTQSEWARLGIEPQSPQLSCGGWRCGCFLRETGSESDGLDNINFKAIVHLVGSHG